MAASSTPVQAEGETALATTPRRSAEILAGVLGERPWQAAALAVSSTLSGLAEAGVLAAVAEIAASLAAGGSRVDVHLGPIVVHAHLSGLLVAGGALAAIRLGLLVPTSFLAARIAADIQAQMRRRLFDAFMAASWTVKADDREGHLQELFNNQVNLAIQGTLQATLLLTYLFSFVALVVSALTLSPQAAGIVVAVALGLFAGLRPLSRAGSRSARDLSVAQLAQASGVSEAARLAEDTQVFGVALAQRARMSELIERSRMLFFRTQLAQRLIPGLYQSVVYLLLVGGLALIYAFDKSGVAALGAVVLMLVRAGTYGNQVQAAYQVVKQSLPFIERVHAAEGRYRRAAPHPGRKPFGALESLSFEDVSFAYQPGPYVLTRISFKIRNGETIGIVGPSGAGKSTLAQLLLGLREPTSGAFLVNGVPARELRSADWTARVAYVPQIPNLIHASATDNIRYLRNLDQAEVEKAARLARIHDDIVGWRDGYETTVGPRGAAISVGQAQRICLARALAGQPDILLLDEPTSSLDPMSERLIQESLETLKGSVTLFIIAHRMSTLDLCDRVMVIVDGKLNAFDSLADFRANNAYYQTATSGSE